MAKKQNKQEEVAAVATVQEQPKQKRPRIKKVAGQEFKSNEEPTAIHPAPVHPIRPQKNPDADVRNPDKDATCKAKPAYWDGIECPPIEVEIYPDAAHRSELKTYLAKFNGRRAVYFFSKVLEQKLEDGVEIPISFADRVVISRYAQRPLSLPGTPISRPFTTHITIFA